ncbi:MAG: hypothetical protein WKG01_08125 [Kofleriaceae bacterium]
MSYLTSAVPWLVALSLALGCSDKDNSSDTDKASKQLREAQDKLVDTRTAVTTNVDDIARRKRELLAEQQALADKEAKLVREREQLGSAETALTVARTAYAAAVKQRFAKLDATLASLGTRTDAAAKDAAAGLQARRELLAAKLATMPTTADASWPAYTKDVDTTFDAIERDLQKATPRPRAGDRRGGHAPRPRAPDPRRRGGHS